MSIHLTEDQIKDLIDMPTAIEAVEAAHRDLALGAAQDVPRERTRTPHTTLHILQGAYPAAGVMGYKAYTSNRSGNRFWVHLFDIAGGALLATLDANWLGMMRTGAAAGVATKWLARKDAARLGVIGAGWQAQSQIEAVCAVRPIREVRVFARRREPLETFCRDMSARLNLPVIAVDTARNAIEGAEVVTTITTSATPVLEAEWLGPGVHVNAAGSNSLIRRELDEATLRRMDVICVDTRATAQMEAGDLLPLVEKGRSHPGQWVELGELIAGTRAGRRDEGALTLFESQGLALQDLALAARVLARAREAGLVAAS